MYIILWSNGRDVVFLEDMGEIYMFVEDRGGTLMSWVMIDRNIYNFVEQ